MTLPPPAPSTSDDPPPLPYRPRRIAESRFVPVRELQYHCWCWGDPRAATDDAPLRVLMHGWMDVAASFQFVVDALADNVPVVAADWRGFGRTAAAQVDSYWFPDYLGDLDALLDALSPDRPVDLLGHSMGGNVVMVYAGVRPQRVRRLVNLEGFGLPDSDPAQAPARMARWLDELKTPQRLRPYASLDEVAQRLRQGNPRLTAERAAWLAPHWAEPVTGDAVPAGREDTQAAWRLRADPAHKRVNPVPYRAAEVIATWRCITAPTLWVEGNESRPPAAWPASYTRADFEQRLAAVPRLFRAGLPDAGHMLHHDQPVKLAERLEAFWSGAVGTV